MPVSRLLSDMTARELLEWQVFLVEDGKRKDDAIERDRQDRWMTGG